MKTTKERAPRNSYYTSIYLDPEVKQIAERLAEESGQSFSQVVRGLILAADVKREERLAQLVTELADLLAVR